MALVVKDRVKETTTTTGTGTITLAGAADGYQSFSVIGNGNTTYYAIVGGDEWEVGVGTYTSSGTTLSRDTVLESSNSGNAVNFSSGEKQVFCTYPAEKMITVDNDGSGSGLDADTVDGIQASSFIRSNTNDNVSGHTEWQDNYEIRLGAGADFRMGHDGTNTYFRNYHHANGSFYWQGEGTGGENHNLIVMRNDTTTPYVQLYYDNAVVLETVSGGVNIAGNTAFHDGYHPNADKWTTARTLSLTGDVTGSTSWDGSGNASITTAVANDSHTHAFNNLTGKTSGTGDYKTSGDFITSGGTASAVKVGAGSGSMSLTTNDGYGNANVCFNHVNGVPDVSGNSFRIEANVDSSSGAKMYFEGKSGTTASTAVSLEDWFTMSSSGATCLGNTVWHAGNDGTGSGLDADTVDGIQASSFVRSDANDAKTGNLTIGNSSYGFGIGTENARATASVGRTATYNEGIFWHSSNSAYGIYRTSGAWTASTYQQLKLDWETGIILDGGTDHTNSGVAVIGNNNSLKVNGNVVWNAGNDGSGSGLDADTVDGIQASSFLRSDQADTKTSGNLIFADSVRANFGAASDLNIYHDGTNSYIDNNKNHLFIRNNVDGDDGGNTYIQAKSGEHGIILYDDAYISLFDNGTERLRVDNPIYAYADIRLQGSGYDLIYDKGTYLTTLSSINPASQSQTIYLPDASGYASVKSFSQGHELNGVSGITLTPANNWRKIEIVLTVDDKVLASGQTTPRVGIDMTANGSAVSWRYYKDDLHEVDYYNQVWSATADYIYSYYFTKESIIILNLWRTDDTNDCRVMFDLQIKEGNNQSNTDGARFYKIGGSTSAAISKLSHQIQIGLGGGSNWNGVEYFTTVEYHN